MDNTDPPSTTSDPPPVVGLSFAADIIKRFQQKILVVRETVISYTSACLVDEEDHKELRNGLIRLCLSLRPLDGPIAVIHTDPAPGFNKLSNDPTLMEHRLSIEIGRVKNRNKNPVAEKAMQELEDELMKLNHETKRISEASLSVAISNLNSRVRVSGLSSRELWTQRDQFTGEQLPIDDQRLILDQHHRRLASNFASNSKRPPQVNNTIPEGSIVYIKAERNKTQSRPRYIVTLQEGPWYHLKKFSGDQLRNTTYKVHRDQHNRRPPKWLDAYETS